MGYTTGIEKGSDITVEPIRKIKDIKAMPPEIVDMICNRQSKDIQSNFFSYNQNIFHD